MVILATFIQVPSRNQGNSRNTSTFNCNCTARSQGLVWEFALSLFRSSLSKNERFAQKSKEPIPNPAPFDEHVSFSFDKIGVLIYIKYVYKALSTLLNKKL